MGVKRDGYQGQSGNCNMSSYRSAFNDDGGSQEDEEKNSLSDCVMGGVFRG